MAIFPVSRGGKIAYIARGRRQKESAAKGVWQKSDEKSDRSVRKSDRKVAERVPKTKKKK